MENHENTEKEVQYDLVSGDYASFVKSDPCKKFVQYPGIINLAGSLKGKSVLDVGCSSGCLTRQLSDKGANIVAYDISREQIRLAKDYKTKKKISYFISDPNKIEERLKRECGNDLPKFDKAISNLVLHYAKDQKHLAEFFRSTYNLLKKGGEFISIVINPEYKKIGKKVYNRQFEKTKEGMKADFLDFSGQVMMTVNYSDFTKKDYENAAIKSGFENVDWIKLAINKEGLSELGSKFWNDFENDCPFVGLVCKKT